MPFSPIEIIKDHSGGAWTREIPENIPRNASPLLLNVILRGLRWRKAPGYTSLGTDADSSAGRTLYNHHILSSEEVLVKVSGTHIKFLDEADSNIFHLTTDATFSDVPFWFDTFNGYMYGGNGVNNFVRWRASSWGALSTAVTGASITIVLGTGEGARFANSGSGMIEDDTFAWTGKSTDTLTGVTGLSSNHDIGSRVIEKLDSTTYSANPKGSVGFIFRNRLYVRDDLNPNFLYFSKLADATTPHDDLSNFTIAGSGAGDAGFILFPARMTGGVTFIDGANNAVAVVVTADGQSWSVSVSDAGGTTVGAFIPFKNLGADIQSSRCLATTDNELVAFDKFGSLRALGYGDQSTTLKSSRLSDRVQPTLDPTIFDGSSGFLKFFGERLLLIGKRRGSEFDDWPESNNLIVVKDSDPDGFYFWNHVNINDAVVWKDNLRLLDVSTGQVYTLFDSRSADGFDIATQYEYPKLDHGVDLIHKIGRKIRIKGAFMRPCQFYLDVKYDNSNSMQTFIINSEDSQIRDKDHPAVSMGTVTMGTMTMGGDGHGDLFVPFSATINLPADRFYYHIQPIIRHVGKETDLEMHALLVYAETQDPDVEFLGKQLSHS